MYKPTRAKPQKGSIMPGSAVTKSAIPQGVVLINGYAKCIHDCEFFICALLVFENEITINCFNFWKEYDTTYSTLVWQWFGSDL